VKVSFLVCAYNEEKTIEETLRSVLDQTIKPDEIVVVNDGSTDGTDEILRRFEKHCRVVNLPQNTGSKAKAQMEGLKCVTGDILAFTDADTTIDPYFIEHALPYFLDASVGAVSGQVLSKKRNWLTAVRQIQYVISQNLYKKGMGALDSILVIPGPAGMIRRRLFNPSSDTIAEDMDMTLETNEIGYRIVYAPDVKVFTDDPTDLQSYIRQTRRWYAGYFQNLRKHFRSAPPRIKVQATIPILENLLTLSGALILIATIMFSLNPVLLSVLLLEILVVEAFVIYGALRLGRKDLLVQAPAYFLIKIVDLYVWLKCLINEMVFHNRETKWLRADRS